MHRGPYIQCGRGLGGILNSMYKSVVPAMQLFGQKLLASPKTQEVLNTVKKSALEAGMNVVKDTLRGKNFGSSVSDNVSSAKEAISESLLSALDKKKVVSVAEPRIVKKRKRANTFSTTPAHGRKAKTRKSYSDLFEENFG